VTILIIGKDGQIGFELTKVLAGPSLVACGRSEIDLSDSDAVRRAVRRLAPRVIINAAAYTAVDQAESQPETAMQINGVAPGVLAEEAKRCAALLVHYSSDYVFDGGKSEPYVERDPPNPINAYGRTKLEGERAIAASGCRNFVLRTSWVYAARGTNFVRTMLRLASEQPSLRIVADQRGAPTWARDIAQATATLLSLPADGLQPGLYHLCAKGVASWHEFASAIFRSPQLHRLGIHPPNLEAISSEQYPTPARRPKNSQLNCQRLAALGVSLPDWRESLDACLEQVQIS
jgi:dTDP-4-dehydrorhamnose reductase